MPVRLANAGKAAPGVHKVSCRPIWITDDHLDEAWNNFSRTCSKPARRHGSNVPGPLEFLKRSLKRRMNIGATERTATPSEPLSQHTFDLGWLKRFRRRSIESQVQWQPPSPPTLSRPKTEGVDNLPAWLTLDPSLPSDSQRSPSLRQWGDIFEPNLDQTPSHDTSDISDPERNLQTFERARKAHVDLDLQRLESASITRDLWKNVRFSAEDPKLWDFGYDDLPKHLRFIGACLEDATPWDVEEALDNAIEEIQTPRFEPRDANVLIILFSTLLHSARGSREPVSILKIYEIMWNALERKSHNILDQIAPCVYSHHLRDLTALPTGSRSRSMIERVLKIMVSHNDIPERILMRSTSLQRCALNIILSRTAEDKQNEHSAYIVHDLANFLDSLPPAFSRRWMLYSLADLYDTSLVSRIGYPATADLVALWLDACQICRHFNYKAKDEIYQSISQTFEPADVADHFRSMGWRRTSKIIFKHWAMAKALTTGSRRQTRWKHCLTSAELSKASEYFKGVSKTRIRRRGIYCTVLKSTSQFERQMRLTPELQEYAPLEAMVKALAPYPDLCEVFVEFALDLLLRLENHGAFAWFAFRASRYPPFRLPRSTLRRYINTADSQQLPLARRLFQYACHDLSLYPQLLEKLVRVPCVDPKVILGFIAADDLRRRQTLLPSGTCRRSVLTGFQVRLVHQTAEAFVSANHLTNRARAANIFRLFSILQARNAPLHQDMANAMAAAGVINPIEEDEVIPFSVYAQVLEVIRGVEGPRAAQAFDTAVQEHQEGPARFRNLGGFWSLPQQRHGMRSSNEESDVYDDD